MYSALAITPPQGALSEDQVGTLGGGISSVRGAAGGARHVIIIASIVFLVSAELGEARPRTVRLRPYSQGEICAF